MNSQMDRNQVQDHRPAGLGGEHAHDHDEQHHEKKSVLKKVKAKAKKIKDTITKHGHSHDHDHDHDHDHGHGHAEDDIHAHHDRGDYDDEEEEEEEMEVDAEVHAAPSAQHDVMLAGAQPTTVDPAARSHGLSSIQDDTELGGGHGTSTTMAGHHGTSPIQDDDILGGAHGTTTTDGRHHGTSSIQHDSMLGGAHGTTSTDARNHGTSPIQDDDILGGAHGTTSTDARNHGTSPIQDDDILGGAHGTTSTDARNHGTSPIQDDDILGGAHGTTSTDARNHGTSSMQHDSMLGGAHGHGTIAPAGEHGARSSILQREAPFVGGSHGSSSVLHDAILGAQQTTTTIAPASMGRHGANAHVSDENSLPSREAHNLRDHRGFITEQVGVSKNNDGVTFGGSQTPRVTSTMMHSGVDVGGKPAQPETHDYSNLPISSGGTSVGRHQKTSILDKETTLEPNPHAPGGDNQPENYQSKVKDPSGKGGEEMGITPILHSLDKMTNYGDEKKNDAELGSSYTNKMASTTSAITDKAIQAKNVVSSKLGYGGQGSHEGEVVESKKTTPSVTDYGKKVASTVYEKVAGAGGAVMSKMPGSEQDPIYDKGVSEKEYIAEKISPGEEDKALSEVISGAVSKEEEEERKEEGRGKVTFSAEVGRQLGGGEEDSVEDLGSGIPGPKGGAMVDKLKDTVTSWLGIGGETEPSSLVWHDIPKDASDQGLSEHDEKGHGTDIKPRLQ